MSEKMLSRRGAFTLLGLAALGFAVPTNVLTTSEAEAQPAAPAPAAPAPAASAPSSMTRGETRRAGRRAARQTRRQARRTARETRRQGRRTARQTRRQARRGVPPTKQQSLEFYQQRKAHRAQNSVGLLFFSAAIALAVWQYSPSTACGSADGRHQLNRRNSASLYVVP